MALCQGLSCSMTLNAGAGGRSVLNHGLYTARGAWCCLWWESRDAHLDLGMTSRSQGPARAVLTFSKLVGQWPVTVRGLVRN